MNLKFWKKAPKPIEARIIKMPDWELPKQFTWRFACPKCADGFRVNLQHEYRFPRQCDCGADVDEYEFRRQWQEVAPKALFNSLPDYRKAARIEYARFKAMCGPSEEEKRAQAFYEAMRPAHYNSLTSSPFQQAASGTGIYGNIKNPCPSYNGPLYWLGL